MTRHLRRTVALLLVPLALAACSGGDSPAATDANTTGAATSAASGPFDAQPGQEVDKDAFIDQTRAAQQDKGTFALNMVLPLQGQRITMTGQADVSDEANPKMKMQTTMPGGGGTVDFVLVDKKVYMKLPGSVSGGKYVEASLSDFAASGGQDLTKMMNPAGTLDAQRAAVQKVTYVGEQDVSGEPLRQYTLELDLAEAARSAGATDVPIPTSTAGTTTTTTQVWVDEDKLIRKMTTDVESTTIEMTMDKYGEPVQIAAPPPASVATMPGLGDLPTTAAPTTG